MPFKGKKGVGKKGRSGRKTKAEELRICIEKIKEDITNEALAELSKKTVFQAIKDYPTLVTAKDLALPIVLKGLVEKKEISGFLTLTELFNQSKNGDE